MSVLLLLLLLKKKIKKKSLLKAAVAVPWIQTRSPFLFALSSRREKQRDTLLVVARPLLPLLFKLVRIRFLHLSSALRCCWYDGGGGIIYPSSFILILPMHSSTPTSIPTHWASYR